MSIFACKAFPMLYRHFYSASDAPQTTRPQNFFWGRVVLCFSIYYGIAIKHYLTAHYSHFCNDPGSHRALEARYVAR